MNGYDRIHMNFFVHNDNLYFMTWFTQIYCTSVIIHERYKVQQDLIKSIYHALYVGDYMRELFGMHCSCAWKRPACSFRGMQKNMSAIVNLAMSSTVY